MIRLRDDLTASNGYWGMAYSCATQNYNVATLGYPSDKPTYGYRTYYQSGVINGLAGCGGWGSSAVGTSQLDAAGGQSGSAIWSSPDRYIRAILIAGNPYNTFHRVLNNVAFDFVKANRV